jgi:HEAT repeat protein
MDVPKTVGIISFVLVLVVFAWIGFEIFHKAPVKIPKTDLAEKPIANPVQEKIELFIKQLQEAVLSKNVEQVSSLMKSLSEIGPTAITSIVSAFNQSNNPEFQMVLIKIIVMIKDQITIKTLLELYPTYINKQPDSNVQKEIIIALSVVGGRSVFNNFVDYLKTEKNTEVRKILCDCITALGDAPKIDAAIKANQDNPMLVQDLTSIKNRLEKNKNIQNEVVDIEKLDLSTSEAIKKLDQILKSDKSSALRILALQKLEKANSSQAVNILLQFIESSESKTDNDKTIRLNAIATLCRMRINEARLAVKKLLENENIEIRKNTVEFLGAFGDKANIPLLNQVIANDSVPEIKGKAQKAIETIKSRNQ